MSAPRPPPPRAPPPGPPPGGPPPPRPAPPPPSEEGGGGLSSPPPVPKAPPKPAGLPPPPMRPAADSDGEGGSAAATSMLRPASARPPPKPPAAPQTETIGGFGVGMLDKVNKLHMSQAAAVDDDDDDASDWRDSEDTYPVNSGPARPRATTGLKAPVSSVPSKVSKPPPKPGAVVAEAPAPAPPVVAKPAEADTPAPAPVPASDAELPPPPKPFRLPTPPSSSSSSSDPPSAEAASSQPAPQPRPPQPPASSSSAAAPSAAASSSSTPSSSSAAPTPAAAPRPFAPTALSSSMAPAGASASIPSLAASSAAATGPSRTRDLEEEVEKLNMRLARMASRLAERPGIKSNAPLQRELELETELDAAHAKNSSLRHEKRSLEITVRELQARLAASEAQALAPTDVNYAPVAKHALQSKADNNLRELYVRAKQEKDKAIRALIFVIGKEKVADFLQKNAASANILDDLLKRFANLGVDAGPTVGFGTSPSSSPRSPSPRSSPTGKKAARSQEVGMM